MRLLLALLLLLFSNDPALAQALKGSDVRIVAGKGWGLVALGAERAAVETVIGRGVIASRYDEVYFVNYLAKGIQISYYTFNDKARAIFFYNKQRGSEAFATFKGAAEHGVSWRSSPEAVVRVYGQPVVEYSWDGGRRIAFPGIDFRWENNVLVRISVFPLAE